NAQVVALVCYIFPNLRVYARARDEANAAELRRLGAHVVVPELVETGFALAGSIIAALEDILPAAAAPKPKADTQPEVKPETKAKARNKAPVVPTSP
ncbi:MAG: hypothetical protein D6826_09300, partial [Alphaproteobacteria bacterium]